MGRKIPTTRGGGTTHEREEPGEECTETDKNDPAKEMEIWIQWVPSLFNKTPDSAGRALVIDEVVSFENF